MAQLLIPPNQAGESPASGIAITEKKGETPMRKSIFKTLTVLSACAALAASCIWAEPSHRVMVKVPFDFIVCNHALPAGDYEVTLDQNRSVALVRGEAKDATTFVLTHPTEARKATEQTKLVFTRYGDRYFLSQIWPLGTAEGRMLPKSRMETELAQTTEKPGIVALVAAGTASHKPIR